MQLSLQFFVLTLIAAGAVPAELPAKPAGRDDVEVITTDSVPVSGTFYNLAVDRPYSPRYVFAADMMRHVIRRKDVQTGVWEVVAGQDGRAGAVDGPRGISLLYRPTSICMNPQGSLVIADWGNNCLRLVSPLGVVTTLAGVCGKAGARDGRGSDALFSNSVKSVVCLSNCSVLVGDEANGSVRAVIVHDPNCIAAGDTGQARFSGGALVIAVGASVLCTLLLVGTVFVALLKYSPPQPQEYSRLPSTASGSPAVVMSLPQQAAGSAS